MIKRILYFTLVAISTAACTEKITVKLDTTYTRVVVDGNIQSDTGVYSIAITKSADYFSNVPVPRICNAVASITDGDKTYSLHETYPGVSGIYQTDPGFAGQVGKTYKLQVKLQEAIAGVTSVEATTSLLSVTHLDSIIVHYVMTRNNDSIWAIKLYAKEPGNETNFYMFNWYRNGELMTDTINKKVVQSDQLINGSNVNLDVIYINTGHQRTAIKRGDTIMLQMSGITKEYFDFINEVRQSGFNIPFFTGPPANIKGNITNGGVGFFSAYSNSFAKCVVK